jgi:hypothetical protein
MYEKGAFMEDIERYGDYNETDEEPSGEKSHIGLILKIVIISVCLLVVGLIIFRVILFSYYPKAMKRIYFNDTLTAYYNEHSGDINAETQKLRAPYDDPDFASFIADNLIIIKGVGQLQLSVRYNSSIFDNIEEKYGVKLDPKSADHFEFELERGILSENTEYESIGKLDHSESAKKLMYTYYKLVFDGVDFSDSETEEWIRLKITLKDVPNSAPYYILIYENTDSSKFSEYKLSGRERP